MGLDASTCSECLPMATCDFEPPEHVPRTSVRAHTCAVVFGRAPCVPRIREHVKRPAAGREKMPMCKKTRLYTLRSSNTSICLSVLSTMYSNSIDMLCDHRAVMAPELCSKVLSAAGKPRHLCDNRDLNNQGRACFFSCLLKKIHPYLSYYYCHSSNLYYFLFLKIEFHPLIPMLCLSSNLYY